MSSCQIREIEFAFAAELAAHALAAAELNPFGEAEVLELGNARAVYSGQWSPAHGVAGLGLDGPVEDRDLQEISRFYFRKERAPAYWLTAATDPSLGSRLISEFHPVRTLPVRGTALTANRASELPSPTGSNTPDLNEWARSFTQVLDPGAKEPGLLALTKIHQANTRFYLGAQGAASYTFFHQGIALVPVPSAFSLLSLQLRDAASWGARCFAVAGENPLPQIYERVLHERI